MLEVVLSASHDWAGKPFLTIKGIRAGVELPVAGSSLDGSAEVGLSSRSVMASLPHQIGVECEHAGVARVRQDRPLAVLLRFGHVSSNLQWFSQSGDHRRQRSQMQATPFSTRL